MGRILVLGAYGLLGSSLSRTLARSGNSVMCQGRRAGAQFCLDPCYGSDLKDLLAQEAFDVVVNLIAATDVDRCESDCVYAYQANVQAVESLIEAIRNCSVSSAPHLIQISSDQVYDGPGPHREDRVSPCNIYALSKLSGECLARQVGATIFRTNFVGKSRALDRPSFSDWLVESLRARRPITLFDDVFFSALHINQLCEYITSASNKKIAGTFNVGCADGISKARFGLALGKKLGLDISNVTIGCCADVAMKARRPLDMRLNVRKFEEIFETTCPFMEQAIELVAQEYMND